MRDQRSDQVVSGILRERRLAREQEHMKGFLSWKIRRWAGPATIVLVIALIPWLTHADERWTDQGQFGLLDADAGSPVPLAATEQIVAALSPGAVVIAEAGATPAQGKDWQVTVAPYFWMARTKMSIDIGQFSRSTTIDFTDIVPQLHGAFAAHAEGTWREWTGFLDLFYVSMGQSEPQ